nr:hypothetical protein [Chlamydiota bacterium]
MTLLKKLSKAALGAVLLLCFNGCGYFCYSPWILETTQTYCSAYRSARMSLLAKNMGIEIIRDQCGVRMYLNLMICPIQPDDPCDQLFTFTYCVGTAKYQGTAYVLEGGQRLWLENHTAIEMMNALYSGSSIQISMGMYQEVFESGNYPELYDWLISWKIYPNKFKNRNFGCAKAPGSKDRKWANINNINPLTILRSRELSRCRKPILELVWVYSPSSCSPCP